VSGHDLDGDPVHTVDDWYDGPRAGATEFEGKPCWYRSIYLDTPEWNPDEDRFELIPITAEVLMLIIECSEIFSRWDSARETGAISWDDADESTFGALPDDMPRYRELNRKIDTFLARTKPQHLVRGTFESPPLRVRWEKI